MFTILLAVVLGATGPVLAQSKEPVKIGLSAAVSGGSAASGEAIKRGLQIAIDEINGKGAVLGGRKLELVIRDDEGNPQKGVTIARELVEREKVGAVFGGLHTTVALAQVPVWQELKVPYMGTWAAGTNITRNGQTPNYVFRVSQRHYVIASFPLRDGRIEGQAGPAPREHAVGVQQIRPDQVVQREGREGGGRGALQLERSRQSPQPCASRTRSGSHRALTQFPEGAQVLRSSQAG
jgi:hypothetical protein